MSFRPRMGIGIREINVLRWLRSYDDDRDNNMIYLIEV
jgi:hypothetical protein